MTITPSILMKKTKRKSSKLNKKTVSVVAKKRVSNKTKLKNKKSPVIDKINIGVLLPEKEISTIEVPRTVKHEVVEDQILETNDESIFDENGMRKKRRGRNKKEKIYFSKKTEDAIVEYNTEEDVVKRNEIYETKIKFSFEKLVENIFNTFKFTYFDNSPLEIQKETVSHLVTNINKFQAGKGKAFSYFSIVAKNYLVSFMLSKPEEQKQRILVQLHKSWHKQCLRVM